jgi:RNA polymerase sigma factor (TIGR02999 family)
VADRYTSRRSSTSSRDTRGAGDELERLFQRARDGDAKANAQIFEVFYDELRVVSRHLFRAESPGQTLEPTGLVNEVFLKLVGSRIAWNDRGHFFAVAANAMHRALVSHARTRNSRRRRERGVVPSRVVVAFAERAVDVLALDAELRRLERELPRVAKIVKLRFYAGRTTRQISADLGTPLRTVQSDLNFALKYLHGRLV